MAQGAVDFKLTGDSGDVVREYKRIIQEQGKVIGQLKKTGAESRKSADIGSKAFAGMRSTIMNVAAGFVGVAGLKMALGKTIESLKEARDTTLQFEDEMTELLSLGTNVENIDAIKTAVLSMSEGWGMARTDITGAMFDLQSGASDLAVSIRRDILKESLELTKVFGGDLRVNLKAITKLMIIYGDELKDANAAQNMIAVTADKAAVTLEEMAVYLPDVASSAKTFGYSLNEVAAAIVVATQAGGKTERTFTGLRNVFLKFSEAEKAGIKLTGDFVTDLKILADVAPEKLKKIFGAESIAVIKNLIDGVASLNVHLQTYDNLTGDIVKSKYLERLKDTAFAFSEISKTAEQALKNMYARKDYAGKWGPLEQRIDAYQLGIAETLPPGLRWLAKPSAYYAGYGETMENWARQQLGRGPIDNRMTRQRKRGEEIMTYVPGFPEATTARHLTLTEGPEAANRYLEVAAKNLKEASKDLKEVTGKMNNRTNPNAQL